MIQQCSKEIKERLESAWVNVEPSHQEEDEKVEEEKIRAEIVAISPTKAWRIVKDSGIMLLPGCIITTAIVYDVVRRDPQALTFEDQFEDKIFGSGYSWKLHTLAIWSMAPNTSKHEVYRPIEEVIGSIVVKRATDITPI